MYVKAHTRGFSFCFSSFLRLLVLPSIQSNQSINTELDVTIRWFTKQPLNAFQCMSRPTPEASLSVFLRFWGCWFFLLYSRIKASTPNWMLRLGDLLQRWSFSRPRREREREREREKAISPFFPCGRVLGVLFLYLLDWLLVIVFYDLLKSQAAVERYETIAISIESTCVLRLFSVKVRKELWELYDRLTTIHDL